MYISNPKLAVVLFIFIALVGTTLLAALNVAPATSSETLPGVSNESTGSTSTAASLTNANNVELIGRFGGRIETVFVLGNYAYASMGSEFVVLDITDPIHPLPVEYLAISVADIFAVGDDAYVSSWDEGLRILDISDPAAPTQVGLLDGYAAEIETVEDDILYVHDADGILHIIDVSNSAVPVEVGTYDSGSSANVEVGGGFLYSLADLSGYGYGLYILDMSDPSNPMQVGFYDASSFVDDIALGGDYVYLVGGDSFENHGFCQCWGYLTIVDVSNPSAPVEIYSSASDNRDIYSVEVSVDSSNGKFYAFTQSHYCWSDYSTSIFDVSNPTAIVSVDGPHELIQDVAVTGDFLFILIEGSLTIWDGSGSESLDYVGAFSGDAQDVTKTDGYAYVAYGSAGLQILDVSNPALPFQAGSLSERENTNSVSVSEGYAYAANENGVRVVDVSDPTTPAQIGLYETGDAQAVAITDENIYVAAGPRGLFIYQRGIPPITDPLSRFGYNLLASDIATQANSVPGSGETYAFVLMPELWGVVPQMIVLDNSDPSQLVQIGDLSLPEGMVDIYVEGNYAYLSGGGQVLIVDITDPASPYKVGLLDGDAVEIVEGNTIFFRDSNTVLRLIDISDLTNPVEIGAYTYGSGLVEVENNLVYILESNRLRIVDISDLTQPTEIGSLDIAEDEYTLQESFIIDGGFVYAIKGECEAFTSFCKCDGRLLMIDVSDPTEPVDLSVDINVLPKVFWISGDYHLLEYRDCYWIAHYEFNEYGLQAKQMLDGLTFSGTIREQRVPGFSTVASIQGNHAYVAYDDTPGLEVWNISVGDFDQISTFGRNEFISDVTVAGEYAYVSSSSAGLHVVDVSEATLPFKVSSFYIDARDTEVIDDYAYVAAGEMGLRVLNISNPADIYEVGFLDTPGEAQAVAVSGNDAYIADGEAGLRVVDISNPAAPTEIGFYDTDGYAQAVSVDDDYIYLADGPAGILILQQLYSVSGKITHANGLPFPGVTVSAGLGSEATTNEAGNYLLDNLISGTHTVMPIISGLTSWPLNRQVTLPPDANAQNFTILPKPVSVTLTPGNAATLVYNDTQGLLTQLDFPADAVTEITTITMTPTLVVPDWGFWFTSHAFDLAAFQDGTSLTDFDFNAPVVVTVHYSDYDVLVVNDESALGLLWRTSGEWQDAASTCNPMMPYTRDEANNILQVLICSVGQFGLFGNTNQVVFPIVFR